MNDIKDKRRKLQVILAEAHRRKQDGPPRPSEAWRKGLMNNLPGKGAPAVWADPWRVMEKLVWRFVPAAVALTLLLAFMVARVGPDPAAEVARLMSADYARVGLYTFYQSE